MTQPRTAPDPNQSGWPRGIAYIIANEGCERFSFYGMKAILYVYLTYLLQEAGIVEQAAQKEATTIVHTFIAGVYALPIVGALIADRLLGKYRTILILSIVYCAGHGCLALFEGELHGFVTGLVLISLGSGGIKPCVTAHVGDQFGAGNWHLVPKVYTAFYFIINFGSMFATLLIPWTKEVFGWSVAFAIPGVLMAIATFFFWLGRRAFVHVPSVPGGRLGLLDVSSGTLLFLAVGFPMFGGELLSSYGDTAWYLRVLLSALCVALGLFVFSYRQRLQADDGFLAVLWYTLQVRMVGREQAPLAGVESQGGDPGLGGQDRMWAPAARRFGDGAVEGAIAVLRIASVFAMVSVFWALFDQHASSWVEQAKAMDRDVSILGYELSLLPSQIQALNPLMVMILAPVMAVWGYPALERLTQIQMRPLTRMTVGMFITSLSFVVVALLQHRLDSGETVHVAWQVIPFFIITLAEVMVSITGLEFAYTQAPRRMKSLIMGFWLFAIALGNVLVAFLAGFQGLPWTTFFWTFAGLMAVAAGLFGLRARTYEYRTYTQ